VGLLIGQWAALVIATTLVAGLCVWIIGWEDDEDDEPAKAEAPADKSPAVEAQPAAGPKKS
jgi:hypothetical protein